MEKSGTSKRIIKFANCMVGPIYGGLAVIFIILTCFWGAISGNGPATVYALGSVIIPAMIEIGYKPAFAAAAIAASSALSVVILPSTTLSIYGVIAEKSISDLYLAGVLPGLIVGLFIIYTLFISVKRGCKGGRFGVVMSMTIAIGMATPPVAANIYPACFKEIYLKIFLHYIFYPIDETNM